MGLRSKQEQADFVAMLDATEKRLDRNARWDWDCARADYQRALIQGVVISQGWITIEYKGRKISFPKDQVVYSVTDTDEERRLMFGHAGSNAEPMRIKKDVGAMEVLDRIGWALKKPDVYEFPIELLDQTNPFAGEWKR